MTIIEQIAHYIADELQLEYEGNSDGSVYYGHLPGKPSKAVCVYAYEVPSSDGLGARIQIIIRYDDDKIFPLDLGMRIYDLLVDKKDLLLVPDGNFIERIVLERGFEFFGVDGRETQLYSANFKVYYCV